MTLLICALFIAFVLVFTWPWVDPYLKRHNATSRLLDALEAEWNREGEPPRMDGWDW